MARRMRFGTWCRKDPDDETPIHYTFKMKEWDGEEHTEFFTSDDICSWTMLNRLRQAWVESIELVKNEFNNPEGEWYVVIYEDED